MKDRRTLPEHDEAIASLAPELRATLASLWRERATTELGAGWAFSLLVTELYALGADRGVLALATRGAHDEVRHAELCVQLASRYAGRDVEPEPIGPTALPAHHGADERLRMQLHAAGLAISETLAAAFLERCLAVAEDTPDASPTVLTVLRAHLADDVAHARVGFAHLASRAVRDDERRAIAERLPQLLRANVRHWRDRIVELPVVPAHGYPAHAELLAGVEEAARDVLVPGFAHIGVVAR